MQQVISASRRTDIPAFYSDWFLNRLAAGSCDVLHPYTKKWFQVSLQPEDVGAIVFWSKNYAPLLPKLEKVEQVTKNLFFHFPITGNSDFGPYPSNMTERGAFRGPGAWNLDLSLSKRFRMGDRYAVQLRVEAYNLFNHANMFAQTGDADVSSFDKIYGYKDGNRRIQLGAKFEF